MYLAIYKKGLHGDFDIFTEKGDVSRVVKRSETEVGSSERKGASQGCHFAQLQGNTHPQRREDDSGSKGLLKGDSSTGPRGWGQGLRRTVGGLEAEVVGDTPGLETGLGFLSTWGDWI